MVDEILTSNAVDFPRVRKAELARLNDRRRSQGRKLLPLDDGLQDPRGVGLALSGGGLRAAAFSLGAIEALSSFKISTQDDRIELSGFEYLDFISCVSGGSYAASSITQKMMRDHFSAPLSATDKLAGAYIAWIRSHSRLLGDYFEIVISWVYGCITGIVTIIPFLLFISSALIIWLKDVDGLERTLDLYYSYLAYLPAIGLVVYFVLAVTFSSGSQAAIDVLSRFWRSFFGICLIAGFIALQPVLLHGNLPGGAIYESFDRSPPLRAFVRVGVHEVVIVSALLAGSGMVLLGLWLRRERFLSQSAAGQRSSVTYSILSNLCFLAILVLSPALIWSVVLTFARWGLVCPDCPAYSHLAPQPVASAALALSQWLMPIYRFFGVSDAFKKVGNVLEPASFVILYIFVSISIFLFIKYAIDANASSFHRYYRARLKRTFFHDLTSKEPLKQDNASKISNVTTSVAPYLLVNCTSNVIARAGRDKRPVDEPFVISSLFFGNDSAGYASTEILEQVVGPAFDLATITAISGAAISPVMGRYTVVPFRMLMSLLALRLGYWVPNPRLLVDRPGTKSPVKNKTVGPKYRGSIGRSVDSLYFMWEMLGLLNVNSRFLYITDGGHTDNSGIYELLRRRCATILAIDSQADGSSLFENMVYLIEFARVRLGVEISLSCKAVGTENGVHCAIGEIRYPIGSAGLTGIGTIVYLKLSLTGDENWDLLCRRRASHEFPFHSTINQNYDELLFNAYRLLGKHIVSGFLSGSHSVEMISGELRRVTDAELKRLFQPEPPEPTTDNLTARGRSPGLGMTKRL